MKIEIYAKYNEQNMRVLGQWPAELEKGKNTIHSPNRLMNIFMCKGPNIFCKTAKIFGILE